MGSNVTWNPDLRGPDYKPSVTVLLPSQGKVSRLAGHTTGREHHVLSSLELDWLYLYDWRPEEIDIREQYAMPIADTVAIARELEIPHPTDRKSGEPFQMSLDFLLTRRTPFGVTEHARSCKYAKDLENLNTLDREEIARCYWELRGVDWRLVTEQDVPRVLVANIRWVHPFRSPESVPLPVARVPWVADMVRSRAEAEPDRSIAALCADLDESAGQDIGTHLSVVRHAISARLWPIDMSQPLSGSSPLPFKSSPAP